MDARPQRVSMLLAATCFLSVQFAGSSPCTRRRPAQQAVGPSTSSCRHPHPSLRGRSAKRPSNFAATWPSSGWAKSCRRGRTSVRSRCIVGPHLGAGGATTFTFINGQPRDWHMEIQGSRERILDSVLPHEITHTIFATHFGRPLPRWADEGAATSVEHVSERTKQDQLLIQFLTSNRGIAFNHMFAMKEYPAGHPASLLPRLQPGPLPDCPRGQAKIRGLRLRRDELEQLDGGHAASTTACTACRHCRSTGWAGCGKEVRTSSSAPQRHGRACAGQRHGDCRRRPTPPSPLASADNASRLVPLPSPRLRTSQRCTTGRSAA